MRCRDCGYSLEGLSTRSRCPECGGRNRIAETRAELQELATRALVRGLIWTPILALLVITLSLFSLVLAPVLIVLAMLGVGVLAEDRARARGWLSPEWGPIVWLLHLLVTLAIFEAYFAIALIGLFRLNRGLFP